MSKFDEQYLDLCDRIMKHGQRVSNDPAVLKKQISDNSKISMPNHYAQTINPVTTLRLPHQVLQFNLSEEFPILTTKFVAFKTAVLEMLWIYQAQSNDVRWLHDRGIKIWDEWEIPEDGKYMGREWDPKEFAHTIGTAYGWIVDRYHLTESLIETLKNDPNNRRMIMSLWQNEWLPTAALPSCVWNTQWNVTWPEKSKQKPKLNLMVTVRSNDVPLGMPFNVAQYAVLCHLIAQTVGMEAGQMTYVINDAHIYENQIDGIKEQLARRDQIIREQGKMYDAPKLWLNPEITDFFKFDNSKELKDIKLIDYQHQGKIKMPVSA